MSDSTADAFKPAKTAAKHGVSVAVWLVVLLVAAAAFGAAVIYSGGVDSALNLIGLGSGGTVSQQPQAPKGSQSAGGVVASTSSTGSVAASRTAAPSTTTTNTAKPAGTTSGATTRTTRNPGLPNAALAAMYREQLQSQRAIGKLVNGQIVNLAVGRAKVWRSVASVPLRVRFSDGKSSGGTMTLRNYKGNWYFSGLSTAGETSTPSPGAFDASVVSIITRQQATTANQETIVDGLLRGGYKNLSVTGVSKGSGTATISVRMSGGSEAPSNGQFVCISKNDGGTPYWFIARFTAK